MTRFPSRPSPHRLRTSLLAVVTALLTPTAVLPAQSAQFAPHAIIASNSTEASQAGIEILKRGGNAVDAAVATGFALAVTLPEAGNIGGGGYMVIRMADGRTAALDYRETAPAAAARNMYVDSTGAVTSESMIGYRAAGVPGSVAGMCAAHRKYGRLPLAAVLAPAIRLAEGGFMVDTFTYNAIAKSLPLLNRFAARDIFLPGGKPPIIGTRLKQPALARTLRRIARNGAAAFYRGELARAMASDMAANGGYITEADLAAYRPVWRKPLVTQYRGHTIIGMPLSSSGGLTMQRFFSALSQSASPPPHGSVAYGEAFTSALRDAFHYRNTQLGDTATRLASRATRGGMSHREGTETTHYSVVDANGNAVSVTTTINSLFGAGAFDPKVGFFWNNEMDDFAARPGVPNQFGLVMGEQNAIAPGKRPLSSMSPTIVLDTAGKLLLVAGARGGPRIITSTAQVILNVIDYHMSLAQAMRAPRLHHQELPDTLFFERDGLSAAVIDSLRAKKIVAGETRGVGLVDAILRVKNGYEGMDDPRRQVSAVGY